MNMFRTEEYAADASGQRWHANNLSVAYALLRITLGINIAIHGISRILAGPASFAAALSKQFASAPLPHFAVLGFGHVLPWLETLIGLSILFGAFTRAALVAGAALIIVLTFGSTLHQDWDSASIQLIYATVYFILIALRSYNEISIDGLMLHGSSKT